ncbi:hypothetical protein DP73_03155 [Desulfosporosinus sp. HMP52]|uniref:ATP-dependent nuclease n=1 Tax=Desulfosporosinus sp. HMP52 TaxID=1487923 RepID=UPI00051FEA1C|nr:AAA family ATPase [Desulfosporosinus sp. HMP52]KGK91434.1 hypothetical protein DP73_03155 [Desulfosporosinus sp. HMP52]
MRLHNLRIEGFRRHVNTQIHLSDATFLIGENNIGKSSVLAALDYLLSDTKKIPENEFLKIKGADGLSTRLAHKIVLTAEFRNVPEEAAQWFGFRGRLFPYEIADGSEETGLSVIYRKTFEPNRDYTVEMKEFKKTLKSTFANCLSPNDFIEAGIDPDVLVDLCGNLTQDKRLSSKLLEAVRQLDDLNDFDQNQEEWVNNPGGIPGNILHKLPKFLLIPAQDRTEELYKDSGTLVKTLNELFSSVRDESENYRQAQYYLNQLALELDPSDEDREFGKMMKDLNKVLNDVFPHTGIRAQPRLSDPNSAIKPQFDVSMSSNVDTSVSLQGTGMVRSAVFALLRYKNIRDNNKQRHEGEFIRPLLIGFEEPEIYLHPNAANQLRDTIYDLASSGNNQILCTTHSPYMIDLSKKPSQTLNNLCLGSCEIEVNGQVLDIEGIRVYPFNTSKAFKELQENEKTYVKMLLKIDDYVARVFFAKKVLIVEGDTEDIVLRESINRMPEKVRQDILQKWQIIKARGKATISSLVKYLKSMGIDPVVIHDEDGGVANAEMHNGPILNAVGDPTKRHMLCNCIEDILGYTAPTKEKPSKAYSYVNSNWGDDWASVSGPWKDLMERVFEESFDLLPNAFEEMQSELLAAATSDVSC